jgi:coniferyl-aldehyde dehydrogenase
MSVQQVPNPQHQSPEQRIRVALEAQRRAFVRDGAPSAEIRLDRLDRCIDLLLRHQDALCRAMSEDFSHRSIHQSRITDIYMSLDSLKHARKHLRGWMRTKGRSTPFPINLTGARARLRYQPKGVVGIIAPWNFPLFLCFTPLAGVLAAGNRAIIKPSEFTPATSEMLRTLIAETFDPTEITVITGGADVGVAFSKQPFDHLLFTGSTSVGRHVMRAAADNLVPVTLELGGKSPTVVGNTADLQKTATKIVAAKMLNAGQICLAPDYVFVPTDRVDAFVHAARKAAEKLYPRPASNPDYTAIINERHRDRLQGYIDEAVAAGASVTTVNPDNEDFSANGGRKLPLTMLTKVTDDMQVMRDEIFGPVLPILPYNDMSEVIDFINARPRPLALYYFGRANGEQRRLLDRTTSGAVTLNDCLYHVTCEDMPFGGVGDSGMGSYHGFEGFQTFSHARGVLQQAPWDSLAVMRPPYGKVIEKALSFLIRD